MGQNRTLSGVGFMIHAELIIRVIPLLGSAICFPFPFGEAAAHEILFSRAVLTRSRRSPHLSGGWDDSYKSGIKNQY